MSTLSAANIEAAAHMFFAMHQKLLGHNGREFDALLPAVQGFFRELATAEIYQQRRCDFIEKFTNYFLEMQSMSTTMSVEEAKALIASGTIICCSHHDREPCPVSPDRRCKTCPYEIAKQDDTIAMIISATNYKGPRAGLVEYVRDLYTFTESQGMLPT